MKYQAIIFDMDGTITDSEHLWDKATERFLTKRALTIHSDEKKKMDSHLQGLPLLEATVHLKSLFNLAESVEFLMEEYAQYASELFEKEIRFIDGFLAFHATLNKHNLKYSIATNADDMTLAATKKALALEALFGEHIYNVSHVQNKGKPKPDIYLYAARQLNIDPRACIAIEDSAHGIRAAKAAQMLCIGINSHNNPEQLTEADIIINGYHEMELTKLLG